MPSHARKHKPARRDEGTIDHDLVKAMAHPLRYELLMKLADRAASPKELSQEVDATLGTVSYHVRLLEQLGVVELVDQQPRRGAVEHFYRATQRAWFSKQGWARVPAAVRRSIAGTTLAAIAKTVITAADRHAFDDPAVHVSMTKLELDGAGYERACAVLDDALQEVLDIQAECAGDRSTALVMMHFDRG